MIALQTGAPKTKDAAPAKVTASSTILHCSPDHISGVLRRIEAAGLSLRSTGSDTQTSTLQKVLHFLGADGLNTYEGTAAGYARLATRIQELEADGWLIAAPRENVIGPDGLYHQAVARYILVGRKADFLDRQMSLLDEVA